MRLESLSVIDQVDRRNDPAWSAGHHAHPAGRYGTGIAADPVRPRQRGWARFYPAAADLEVAKKSAEAAPFTCGLRVEGRPAQAEIPRRISSHGRPGEKVAGARCPSRSIASPASAVRRLRAIGQASPPLRRAAPAGPRNCLNQLLRPGGIRIFCIGARQPGNGEDAAWFAHHGAAPTTPSSASG